MSSISFTVFQRYNNCFETIYYNSMFLWYSWVMHEGERPHSIIKGSPLEKQITCEKSHPANSSHLWSANFLKKGLDENMMEHPPCLTILSLCFLVLDGDTMSMRGNWNIYCVSISCVCSYAYRINHQIWSARQVVGELSQKCALILTVRFLITYVV